MIDKYEEIFNDYKNFIKDNSKYGAEVVKYNKITSTYFPLITCISNITDSDESSKCRTEYYEGFYFTIDIYTKDKIVEINGESINVASQEINNELTKLTIQFFGEKLNMKRTLCKPTPNLDTNVLRRTTQYQCLIGNARGNIIRR